MSSIEFCAIYYIWSQHIPHQLSWQTLWHFGKSNAFYIHLRNGRFLRLCLTGAAGAFTLGVGVMTVDAMTTMTTVIVMVMAMFV